MEKLLEYEDYYIQVIKIILFFYLKNLKKQ